MANDNTLKVVRWLSQLQRSDLRDKTCLLRVNLDVKPAAGNWRLKRAVPTINFLLKNKARIIIFGHRGRPRRKESSLSVKTAVAVLSRKVKQKLEWLENIRFDPRERAGDRSLAKELAMQADLFINDDFAAAHRRDATIVYLPRYLPACGGLLMEEEWKVLSQARDKAVKPLTVVIGGIKVEDKADVVRYLSQRADYFLLGSAYKKKIVKSPKKTAVVFPVDYSSKKEMDIGPETIAEYKAIIKRSRTIIWNGPLGKFENKRYRQGSAAVAEAIAVASAFSVVGGGHTLQLLDMLGISPTRFGFASTGGGSMLALLAGKKLPAIEALQK